MKITYLEIQCRQRERGRAMWKIPSMLKLRTKAIYSFQNTKINSAVAAYCSLCSIKDNTRQCPMRFLYENLDTKGICMTPTDTLMKLTSEC